MKKREKLAYLHEHHFSEWIKEREKSDNALSAQQSSFCICGRLATGLHERTCRKFNDKVNALTIQKLAHLLRRN